MPQVEKLVSAIDPISYAVLYTFSKGTEFDQTFSLATPIEQLMGADYGFDVLGANPAPVQARKTTWKFIHAYAVGETYSSVKNAIMLALGHGRPILLQKALSDGTTMLLAEARLETMPDRATIQHMLYFEAAITFEQRSDWYSANFSSTRYDSGYRYDSGLRYDVLGALYPVSATATNFTLINNGTINERQAVVTFNGPLTGPFYLTNLSCDVRGRRTPAGYTGPVLQTQILPSLLAGQYITIDGKGNAIYSNVPGITPWAQIYKSIGQKYYFEVLPGSNSCQLTQGASTAGGSLYVLYRDRYR